jgi:anti-sigma-K factor RskA
VTTADLHALSGAYALDAVDDIERAAFTRHLAECEACTAEVAEFREVAALLGELAEQPPPMELRSTVLAEVSRTRQASPAKNRKERPEVAADLRAAQRWRRATVASIAAAVLAVVGVWAGMNQQLRDKDSQVAALQADRERIYAVMNAKDVIMRGNNLPDGGRVAAAVSASQKGGVAMIAGLALPPRGEVYQMWLMDGAKALSSALVIPADATGGTMLFDKWVPGADTIGVTLEPSGGSTSPTSAPLTTFKLA